LVRRWASAYRGLRRAGLYRAGIILAALAVCCHFRPAGATAAGAGLSATFGPGPRAGHEESTTSSQVQTQTADVGATQTGDLHPRLSASVALTGLVATAAPSASPAAAATSGSQANTASSPSPGGVTPTPPPTPTFTPAGTPEPVFVTPPPSEEEFPHENGTPAPLAPPAAPPAASPGPTQAPLPPGIARVTADEMYGRNTPTGGFTAYGHVELDYNGGRVTADQAVYDAATKILRATGHVQLTQDNGDSASGSALEYHADTDRVEVFDVVGSTGAVYFQGEQIQGRLYYRGESAIVDPNGHTIIMNGWVTTCDPQHPAYHISGKQLEIRPHDRLIARSSALFLGKLLVAALGVLVVPLTEEHAARPSQYAPRIGYNSAYGIFIRNFINFYRGPTWYGTYHVDLYQKVGLGLGADLFFARADGRGSGELSVYNLDNTKAQQQLTGTRNTSQVTLNLQRMFSGHLSGALSFNYSGQSAIYTALPSTESANLSLTHTGARSTTSYVLTDTASGPSHSFGGIIQHTIALSPSLSQMFGLTLQDSTTTGEFSRSIGLNTDTHLVTPAFDADLVIATNHGLQTSSLGGMQTTTPVVGIQRVPELTLRSRPFAIASLRLPVSATLIDGIYNDQYDDIETSRLEFDAQVGPGILRIGSDTLIDATASLRQDAYGTGDLLGALSYQVTMQNYFGHHADNTLLYTAQSVRGYTPMPSLDRLTGLEQISEVLNLYNAPFYRFTASTSYNFQTKQLSAVNYQLNLTPTPYALVNLGTSYTPGVGYSPLVIQLATPLSPYDQLQFSGDYDFGSHALQGQNWFLSHTVGNCYVVRVAYHQPLKEVDLSLSLLAFPGQSASFGINNNGPIIAQGF
jgi:hypothetical protein